MSLGNIETNLSLEIKKNYNNIVAIRVSLILGTFIYFNLYIVARLYLTSVSQVQLTDHQVSPEKVQMTDQLQQYSLFSA